MQQQAIAAPHAVAPARRHRLDLLPYLMLAPALLAIGIFSLLPQKLGLEPLDYELFDLLATQAAFALYCTGLHAKVALEIERRW